MGGCPQTAAGPLPELVTDGRGQVRQLLQSEPPFPLLEEGSTVLSAVVLGRRRQAWSLGKPVSEVSGFWVDVMPLPNTSQLTLPPGLSVHSSKPFPTKLLMPCKAKHFNPYNPRNNFFSCSLTQPPTLSTPTEKQPFLSIAPITQSKEHWDPAIISSMNGY